ncbi:hypothetical protein BKA93DRAFT_750903 [Sparassis latifolia]
MWNAMASICMQRGAPYHTSTEVGPGENMFQDRKSEHDCTSMLNVDIGLRNSRIGNCLQIHGLINPCELASAIRRRTGLLPYTCLTMFNADGDSLWTYVWVPICVVGGTLVVVRVYRASRWFMGIIRPRKRYMTDRH